MWCWRVPWTARRSNQSILKEINPEYSVEGLMLKLKLHYFGALWWEDEIRRLIGKDPDAGKDWRQEKKGVAEDEMFGWPHWFNEYELEQTPGDSEGQGSLACCSSRIAKSQKQLWNWTSIMIKSHEELVEFLTNNFNCPNLLKYYITVLVSWDSCTD